MAGPPIDPERALPWQKLAYALADLLRIEPDAGSDGLDPHEARIERMAAALAANGIVDLAALAGRMAALALKLEGDKDRGPPRARFSHAGPNDIGGMPGGPIDSAPGRIEPWERLSVALANVLGANGVSNVHERRRAQEELGDDYNRLAYFERAVAAQAAVLLEKGIVTRAELDNRIAGLRTRR